jgi:uncharacterized protein (TIGR00251 family)
MKSTLVVRVQTRASKPGIEKIGEREYKINVKAAPTKGKANAEVIRILASYLDVPGSCFTIVRGQTSHHKLIAFDL